MLKGIDRYPTDTYEILGDLLSEAGAGLEGHLEDAQLMSYQFHIPDYLCGELFVKS